MFLLGFEGAASPKGVRGGLISDEGKLENVDLHQEESSSGDSGKIHEEDLSDEDALCFSDGGIEIEMLDHQEEESSSSDSGGMHEEDLEN